MTHNEWEQGKNLTIHNATKEQLQFMVLDRDLAINKLTKELEEKEKMISFLLNDATISRRRKNMNHPVLEHLKRLIMNKYGTLDDQRGAYLNGEWLSVEKIVELINQADKEY